MIPRVLLLVPVLACLAPAPAQELVGPRFETLDVVVHPAGVPLGAWQVELVDVTGAARVVGIEGGQDPAFADPPAYDPAALAGGRVVLAAFSLAPDLPTDRTRVARVHVAIDGGGQPDYSLRLQAAAGPDGALVGARVELVR